MINLDVRRLLDDHAYPSLQISVEFRSVERYLELLSEFVPHIQDQTLVRFMAEIERESSTLLGEEVLDKIEGVKSVIENLIPTRFYGSFVIVLYSAIESALTKIAAYVQQKEAASLAVSDLREPNTLKRLTLYLETLMKQPLNLSTEMTEHVQQLQLVRNVLAHANGSLKEQRDDRRQTLVRMADAKVGVLIENNALIVTTAFLHRSFSAAEAVVNALLNQVAVRYPVNSK